MGNVLLWVVCVSVCFFVKVGLCSLNVPPPLPVLPLPSANQLKWQQREMIMFIHFGINTFTNMEKGTGKEDPRLFNPQGLNTEQWATVAKEAGFSLLILTAKHHDGFCLWPSAYTNHSVKSSMWEDGKGDVVKDLSEAARAQGLDFGLYLSPWDRFEPFYGNEVQYNEFYLGQLQELLTRYLNTGDPYGTDWIPPECDISIRKGWFWHPDQTPKSLNQLLDIYYTSVGRNCVLLLNVPPNITGLLSGEDVERLMEFNKAIKTIFSEDLSASASVTASSMRGAAFSPSNVLSNDLWTYWAPKDSNSSEISHWIELNVEEAVEFNVVRIQEAIGLGQRVMEYGVYASGVDEKKMMVVSNGTTIGYKKLHRLEKPVKAIRVLLEIWKFKGDVPIISSFGLHFDPFYNGFSP